MFFVEVIMIKILNIRENAVDMQVASAQITFALRGNNIVDIVRIPPPHECYVPQNIMWEAKKQAKTILLGKKEKSQKTSA